MANDAPIKGSLQSERFSKALRELREKISKRNEYNTQLRLINKKLNSEVSTLQDLNDYLEKQTGFANLELAADSLNVKPEYLKAFELSAPEIEAELIVVNKDGSVEEAPEAIDILKDRFTPEVHPKFQETARKLYEFKAWYDELSRQEKLALEQFRRTEIKIKPDGLLYVH